MTAKEQQRIIKFRAWDNKLNMMHENAQMYGFYQPILPENEELAFEDFVFDAERFILMQFTGLTDKHGKEIYEGDHVMYRRPYRTTQTHTGDNIPNGSYTEPMEAGIMTHEGTVVFMNGCFMIAYDEERGEPYPIYWADSKWDLQSIKDAIACRNSVFDDPEEGDLQYLIHDVAKVKDADELIKYLTGFEILGNLYQDKHLLG